MTNLRAPGIDRTLRGARAAAAAGLTDDWVHEFLSSGLGQNPPMAVGLRRQRRWWIGPVLVPLVALPRICGPEPEMPYRQSEIDWEKQLAAITTADPEQLPPIIVQYCGTDPLLLCDGSHRHEVMRRRGADRIWTLIWCNSEEDFVEARAIYSGIREAPPSSLVGDNRCHATQRC